MSVVFEFPKECPVLPGYFFTRDGTFSVGTSDGPFYKGYPCKIHGKTYRRIKTTDGEFKLVHRMVAYTFCHNPVPSVFELVDHINGLTEDNRDCNLRWLNPLLNSANSSARNTYLSTKRPIMIKNKRVFVTIEPRWESRITMRGKTHKLGFYVTEKEACTVSRAFRKKQFAEIYLGILNDNSVSPQDGASLDIQPVRPPRVVTRAVLPDTRTEWVGEARSARMCFCGSHS